MPWHASLCSPCPVSSSVLPVKYASDGPLPPRILAPPTLSLCFTVHAASIVACFATQVLLARRRELFAARRDARGRYLAQGGSQADAACPHRLTASLIDLRFHFFARRGGGLKATPPVEGGNPAGQQVPETPTDCTVQHTLLVGPGCYRPRDISRQPPIPTPWLNRRACAVVAGVSSKRVLSHGWPCTAPPTAIGPFLAGGTGCPVVMLGSVLLLKP